MLNDVYTCQATLIFEGDPRVITEITQNHLEGLNNSDVRNLFIHNQQVNIIPINIGAFFPNLEGLAVTYCGLEEVNRESLTNMPNLRQIDFFENRIREVNNNLFDETPLLEAFSVYYNPVRHVASTAFDNLPALTNLHFSLTFCINERADESRDDVEKLMFQLNLRCPPTLRMIQDEILNGFEFQRKIDIQIANRINPLTYHVFELERIIEQNKARITQLERQVEDLTRDNTTIDPDTTIDLDTTAIEEK